MVAVDSERFAEIFHVCACECVWVFKCTIAGSHYNVEYRIGNSLQHRKNNENKL